MGSFKNMFAKVKNIAATVADSGLQQPDKIDTNNPVIGTNSTSHISGSGLAGSAAQPTLTSGVQNPTADSTQFGNMTNGLGESKFGKKNVIQSQSGSTGLGMIGDSNNTNELNNDTEIVSNSLEMPKFGLGKINNDYKIVGGTNLI